MVSLETALEWHLTYNHFPAVDPRAIPGCLAAIALANDGDWDCEVEVVMGRGEAMPWTWIAEAREVVETFHLDELLGEPERNIDDDEPGEDE